VDGGKSWKSIANDGGVGPSQVLGNPLTIYFLDEGHGWLSGKGRTWETFDGGSSWKESFESEVRSVSFFDRSSGWMSLESESATTNQTTDDGGKTWRRCPTDAGVTTEVSFVSGTAGWGFLNYPKEKDAEGYRNAIAGISKTEDGGCRWSQIWKAPNEPDTRYADLFFLNENVGWFSTITANGLFRTDDGGKTWLQVRIPERREQIETFYFFDRSLGWLLFASPPEAPIAFETLDGGASWIPTSRDRLIELFASSLTSPRAPLSVKRSVVIYNR
jgi:photosystem II stability/assembly factor-like uncharacterized protein